MHASVQGALAQLDRSWRVFTYKGIPLTKIQAKAVLEYADRRGYKSTGEILDSEIEQVLKSLK